MTSVSDVVAKRWPRFFNSSRRASTSPSDFAVEDDYVLPIGAVHRLIAGCEVDDSQPAMPEPHVAVFVVALTVRTAMRYCASHATKHVAIDSPGPILMKDSSYSAHGLGRFLSNSIVK